MLLQLREYIKKENTGKILKKLIENDSLSESQLRSLQYSLFNDLFSFVKKTHNFYKESLPFSIELNSIECASSFIHLFPIIDKSFISQNKSQWVNNKLNFVKLTTSGSSGHPFEIFHSKISYETKAASKERSLYRFGIGRNDLQIMFGCGFDGHKQSYLNRLKIRIHNQFILNKIFFDITKISRDAFPFYLKKIHEINPVTIWSYPSFLYEIAVYGIKNNVMLKLPKLKAVILSGESFTDLMRDTIKDYFQKPIIDEYNSNEGFLASSCPSGQLHINEDTVYMLVRKSNGELSRFGYGELVCSQFYSHAYPLINYLQGDLIEISKEKCICGSSFRVIKKVYGRSASVIIKNGSELISSTTFGHIIAKSIYINNIVKFQLVQNSVESANLFLVLNPGFFDKINFENFINNILNFINVHYHYVNDIDRDSTGKYKDVIVNI
jgi:phenylacetate-CoA ligase